MADCMVGQNQFLHSDANLQEYSFNGDGISTPEMRCSAPTTPRRPEVATGRTCFMSTVPQAPAPMYGFPVAATSTWQLEAVPTPYDYINEDCGQTGLEPEPAQANNRGGERKQRKHASGGGNSAWDDTATTVMIRNLPNKYSQQMLLRTISESGFQPCVDFDFFYLPMDRGNGANLGYGFLNFIDASGASAFAQAFQGRRMRRFNSRKTIDVMPALIQGYEANKLHYAGTRVVHADDYQCRPLFLREAIHASVATDATKGIVENQQQQVNQGANAAGCAQDGDESSLRRRRGGGKRRAARGGGRGGDEVVNVAPANPPVYMMQPQPVHHHQYIQQERYEYPLGYGMACRSTSKDSGTCSGYVMGEFDSRASTKDMPSQWSSTGSVDQDGSGGFGRQLTPDSSLHTSSLHTPVQGGSRRPSEDYASRRGSFDLDSRRPSMDVVSSRRGSFDLSSRRGSFDFAMPYEGFHRCSTPEFSPLDESPSHQCGVLAPLPLGSGGIPMQPGAINMSMCQNWAPAPPQSSFVTCTNCGNCLQPNFQFCPTCSSPTKQANIIMMPPSPAQFTASTANSPTQSTTDSAPQSPLQPR